MKDNRREARIRKRQLIREAYKRELLNGEWIIPVNSQTSLGIKIDPEEYVQMLYDPSFDTLIALVDTSHSPYQAVLYKQGKWAVKDTRIWKEVETKH